MEPKNNKLKADVGVVVARFQVDELTKSHVDLIHTVAKYHHRVIIFLGLAPTRGDPEDPLDYQMRKQMLLQAFDEADLDADLDVLFIRDKNDDVAWSADLDFQISNLIGPTHTVTLYGGRDAFVNAYTGRYPTQELEGKHYDSGTEVRNKISKRVKGSRDFRAGVIWGSRNCYPTAFPTVDVAVLDRSGPLAVLLCKKPDESKYRFVGGFASPDSDSFEEDAKRETREETGLSINRVRYVGSKKIDDWRYRKSPNKIKTLFFTADYEFGKPKADDDIEKVAWVRINVLNDNLFMPEHVPLFHMLLKALSDEIKPTSEDTSE